MLILWLKCYIKTFEWVPASLRTSMTATRMDLTYNQKNRHLVLKWAGFAYGFCI